MAGMTRGLGEIVASGGNPRDEEEVRLLASAALETIQRHLRPDAALARELYDDWSKKEYWTAIEAAALCIGINPLLDLIQYMAPDDAGKFHKLLDLIQRKFGDRVSPSQLVDWARTNDVVIESGVLEAIEKRSEPAPSRPQDLAKRETTADKMIVAMAVAKYGYKQRSDNAVAQSIAQDFQDLDSGMSLSKNTIITRLNSAVTDNPTLEGALARSRKLSTKK